MIDQPDSLIFSHQERPINFQFQKRGKEKIKERQFHTTKKNMKNTTRIQHVYTALIQRGIHTTRIIQHKVSVLGAGL